LTILEKLENANQAIQWTDNLPTKYLYSYGIAGERFFREIKNNGRLMGAKCKKCKLTYLPPRLYCEECFEKLEAWAPIKAEGEISAYTVGHISGDGTRLQEPKILALVRFEGVKGGMIHLLGNLGRRKVAIGMRVQPKFKPKPKRTGSLTDIEYFEPV
jgi:uncharacterized OB-fold protein